MKILKTLAVFALALCAALVRADPPSQVGRLNFISGPVSFAPAEASSDWTAATLNRPITTGDRLWADRGARAEMHIGSTAIRTTELTSVDVLNIDDRNIQLGLADGGVNVRLRNLPRGNSFEVDTPHGAVILSEPGSYRISVDPSGGETTVNVRSGQVDVFTSSSSFPVNADQQARITGTNFLSYDIAAAPPMDEFDRWAARRDRKEDRIASMRYVPPEMTGYEDLDDYGSWRIVGDYGTVWVPASVPVGWAPYRYGHWVWISPWGWTWVDSAPWGFAPFHYGRWVWVGRYWAWAPGPVAVRPVYAPALVAFVGGSNFSVSIGIGSAPAVAWVPLGWREPYIPWYRVSPTYVRDVNLAHVRNINVTNIYNITNQNTTVTNINYANRDVPSGVTVVRREHFVSAKPVEPIKISSQALATAPVTSAAPVHTPERASFAMPRPGPRPPAGVVTREVVAVNAPPAPERDDRANVSKGDRGPAYAPSSDERPRVRLINRQQRVELQAAETQRGSAPAAQAQSAAETQRLQEQQAGRNRAERANEKRAQQVQPGQQAERQERREQAVRGQGSNTPQTQSAPQPETRATPVPAPEQRTQQQDRQRQQQAQEQQAREQQARQREMQQREEERQKAQQQRAQQQAQEQQAREQQAREQRAQQQRAQQQAQEQQAREQRAQQQRAQQQAQEQQAREQRAQQQRAQQQAQEQQAREQQARQRELQQRGEERQRAQQQRAQQQAQEQQAREQQARQRENAEKHAPQAAPAAERRPPPQQHVEQPREKGRDRQRAEKSEKS